MEEGPVFYSLPIIIGLIVLGLISLFYHGDFVLTMTGHLPGSDTLLGNDGPANHAIDESNRWYQDEIVNRSLNANASCTSRTVVERFRITRTGSIRIT